jgi:hypothetical protein
MHGGSAPGSGGLGNSTVHHPGRPIYLTNLAVPLKLPPFEPPLFSSVSRLAREQADGSIPL